MSLEASFLLLLNPSQYQTFPESLMVPSILSTFVEDLVGGFVDVDVDVDDEGATLSLDTLCRIVSREAWNSLTQSILSLSSLADA